MTDPHLKFLKYLDGDLSEVEFAELNAWIHADPRNALELAKFSLLESQLRQQLSFDELALEQEMAPTPAGLAQQVRQFVTRPTQFSLSIAALTMVLLITVMAFSVAPFYRALVKDEDQQRIAAPRIVAEITSLHEAAWAKGQTATHRGAFLQNGRRLELDAGLAEVTFRDGAVMVVEGPASFTLAAENACQLHAGRIACEVTPAARGFTVHTPTARVVDLGTEFCLAVDEIGAVDVVVVRGSVETHLADRKEHSAPARRLSAGQKLRVTQSGRFSTSSVEVADFALRDAIPFYARSDHRRLPVSAYEYTNASFGDGDNVWPDSLDGGRELVNGRLPLVEYPDPQWVGFFNSPADGQPQPLLTFDLGQPCVLQGMTIAYLHSADVPDAQAGGTVTAPEDVRISISDDGQKFSEPQLLTPFDSSPGNAVRTARQPLAELHGRYVRLDFRQSSPWTFLGEVKFFGTPANEPSDVSHRETEEP